MRSAWILLLACASLLADDGQDLAKGEFQQLAGSWTIVSIERDGTPQASSGKEKWVFEGDQAKVYFGDQHFVTHRFVLGPTAKPKTMDQYTDFARDGSFAKAPFRGVYEHEGNTLRICLALVQGAKRPGDLTTAKDSGSKLYVFHREKR